MSRAAISTLCTLFVLAGAVGCAAGAKKTELAAANDSNAAAIHRAATEGTHVAGDSAALLERICSSCHAVQFITAKRRSRDEWAAVTDEMIVRGARGTEAELQQVIDYLATHYGVAGEADSRGDANASEHASAPVNARPHALPEKAGVVEPSAADSPTRQASANWMYIGRDPGGSRFSPLNQITTENVRNLEVAWRFELASRGGRVEPTGTAARPRMSQQTPLAIDGVLYITSPYGGVAALEAHTGREIWWQQLEQDQGLPSLRSLAYWPGDDKDAPRLFLGTTSGLLLALDAATGKPIKSFGEHGAINLRRGVADAFPNANYSMTSPPAIFGDVLITGSRTPEQPELGPSGAIRGWNIRTGEHLWTFNTIPQPGEANHEVWEGDSWRNRSGGNAWGLMTVDQQTGTVFVPLGTVTYDYYGGDRPGTNLYGDSLLALDAKMGTLRWHYQIVHHDVWDYDLNAAPVLVEVRRNGRVIPAVAQSTKQSLLFVFDRETGEPVHPIEERPVQQEGFLAGEHPWPTQPHPVVTPPLARANFSPDELARITEQHTALCKDLLENGHKDGPQVGEGGLRTGPLYTPYNEGGTIMFPGTLGGINWHGMTYDPQLGLLIGATMSLGEVFHMVRDPANPEAPLRAHRYKFWDDERKWPCSAPPWGELVAVDVNSGELAWRRPLGSYPELERLGVKDAGTPVMGAAITTAGGLTFIGGTLDNKLRAFASQTGEELWSTDVGAASHNIPSTYLGRDGRQYLAVIVSGGGYMGDPIISPVLIVYRLPTNDADTRRSASSHR